MSAGDEAAPAAGAGTGSYAYSYWQPVILDLVELDAAGALGGIRAIIAERLARLRNGLVYEDPVGAALAEIGWMDAASAPGSPRRVQVLATAAALLATEIDRLADGG